VTTPACPDSWDDFPGAKHSDEVMAAHAGQPSIAEQDRTHGAMYIGGGLPAVDNGPTGR
jgi:hypothetical protein